MQKKMVFKYFVFTVCFLTGIMTDSICGANEFPSKPISLIVTTQPGGSADPTARPIADVFQKYAGQPMVIDYKPGSGGAVAALAAKNAKPDGYTLFFMMVGQTIAPHINQTLGYTADDFIGIARISNNFLALIPKPGSSILTMGDLIKEAKRQDGKLTIGAYGAGSQQRVATHIIMKKYGVKLKYVPFDSESEVIVAVLGGHIDACFINLQPALPQHEAGKLKIIAISGDSRPDFLPDVPTMKEQGFDLPISGWYGIAAPKDTPMEIITKLSGIIAQVIKDPGVVESYKRTKVVAGYLPPDEFQRLVKQNNIDHKAIVEEFIRNK